MIANDEQPEGQIPLTNFAMFRGLVCCALTAWLLVIAVDIVWPHFCIIAVNFFFNRSDQLPHIETALATLRLYALVGIPFTCLVSVGIGLPVWRKLDQRGFHSRGAAIRVGALFGFALTMISTLLGFAVGLETRLSDTSSYNSYSYGYQIIDDGLPTALGWLLEIIKITVTTAIGAASGLVAWTVAVWPWHKKIK